MTSETLLVKTSACDVEVFSSVGIRIMQRSQRERERGERERGRERERERERERGRERERAGERESTPKQKNNIHAFAMDGCSASQPESQTFIHIFFFTPVQNRRSACFL